MFKEVMAGACAGVTGTVLGFPLDRYMSPYNFQEYLSKYMTV